MGGIAKEILSWQDLKSLWQASPAFVRHGCRVLTLALLLGLGMLIVHATGGTRFAYPYLMLIPVLLAGAWYFLFGALATALVAGLLMAVMPLTVATGEAQTTLNWLVRLGLYLLIGGFAGALFARLRKIHLSSERAARTDPSTRLPNEVALEDDLSRYLNDSASPSSQAIGLILVRVDDMNDILEALGADASRALMLALHARFDSLAPALVGCYRVSGAELMLLFRCEDIADLERRASQVIELGEDNLEALGVPLRVQLLAGSSLQQGDGDIPKSLVREARTALLAASERHRSYCHYQPALARRTVQNIKLIARVREGLQHGEFELHYQPKLRLSDGTVCGCEGLIRWRDRHGSLIAPGMFMPKVETTTLIAPVTRFVVSEACRFITRFEKRVSVNFSVRNLMDERLLMEVGHLIEQAGIAPSLLEIEITESAFMHDLVAASKALERLRGYGVQVSIDDFGTGFASFEYLRHLPITGLKVDRAFIRGMEQDPRAQKLVACLIDVGHALGLEVTAEGVETDRQHGILRGLQCDQAQGYLYTRALPAVEMLAWHRHHAQLEASRDAWWDDSCIDSLLPPR